MDPQEPPDPGPGKPVICPRYTTRRLCNVLHELRLATRHRLAQAIEATNWHTEKVLAQLLKDRVLRSFPLPEHTVYLAPTPEFEVCECDGICVVQAETLTNPNFARLWSRIHRRGWCDSTMLAADGRAWGWPRATLLNRLSHLQRIDLVDRIRPTYGDRRLRRYHAKEPLASARSILGDHWKRLGQTDEGPSTEEDS